MTSLVFGNFNFDYHTYRLGLGFRLGFGLGLGLGLRLGLRVSFIGFISKCLSEWNIRQASSNNFRQYGNPSFKKFEKFEEI